MADRLVIDVFCEDSGHETFLRNLIKILAIREGIATPLLRPHSARGGHGRAISSLKSWQRALKTGRQPRGDALLVLIDANSSGWRSMLRTIQEAVDSSLYPSVLIGCPDPHVEVWCTADPEAFQSLFSVPVPRPPTRSGRLVYKQWLADALEQAGEAVLTDPMAICLDLLPIMDMERACRNNDSLNHLVSMASSFLPADVQLSKLMALCDHLEQQLSQADQQRRRVLEALLAEALVGRLSAKEESHADIA